MTLHPARSLVLLLLVAVAAPSTHASPPGDPSPPPPPLAGLPGAADGGFHMEPRPAFDEVFGDAAVYRKTIDRFLLLGDGMQRTREQFARAVQSALVEIQPRPGDKTRTHKCPADSVAEPYVRALGLGQGYLRTGRELTRRYDEVRELDRLGETIGLTPDYRVKVKRVLAQYPSLLTDYREMKVAFHDQLSDELRFAGCDLEQLVAKAGPKLGTTKLDDTWPTAQSEMTTPAVADASGATIPETPAQQDAASTLQSRLPDRPLVLNGSSAAADRSGILFFVDNTRCPGGTRVALDGRLLGDVPARTRAAFQSTPGPHDLCVLPIEATVEGTTHAQRCGDAGTIRRSYLHEGWTISLRCE